MKNDMIKKTGITLMIALLLIISTVQAGFADSFINETAIQALKDFKFGHIAEPVAGMANEPTAGMIEDSFVDNAAVKALENFKFGQTAASTHNPVQNATDENFASTMIDEFATQSLPEFSFDCNFNPADKLIP